MLCITVCPANASRHDRATCVWHDRSFEVRSFSARSEMARRLIAAGCPDQPWESRTPDGTRSLHGPSLHRLAERVLVEEHGRLAWRRWRPHHRA